MAADPVELVQKLIALAVGSDSHEARSAAHKACLLIKKHNLTIGGNLSANERFVDGMMNDLFVDALRKAAVERVKQEEAAQKKREEARTVERARRAASAVRAQKDAQDRARAQAQEERRVSQAHARHAWNPDTFRIENHDLEDLPNDFGVPPPPPAPAPRPPNDGWGVFEFPVTGRSPKCALCGVIISVGQVAKTYGDYVVHPACYPRSTR